MDNKWIANVDNLISENFFLETYLITLYGELNKKCAKVFVDKSGILDIVLPYSNKARDSIKRSGRCKNTVRPRVFLFPWQLQSSTDNLENLVFCKSGGFLPQKPFSLIKDLSSTGNLSTSYWSARIKDDVGSCSSKNEDGGLNRKVSRDTWGLDQYGCANIAKYRVPASTIQNCHHARAQNEEFLYRGELQTKIVKNKK